MKKSIDTLQGALVYEVFPRTYGKRGTFEEIGEDLPRIRDLGVDYLYLMPIHPIGVEGRKGENGSPYSIRDYRAIDPDYGNEESFRKLIEEAHSLGLKVMMDIVFSHTSRDSVLSQEHPEWFYRDASGNFANKVPEWTDIIDLDFTQQGLWEYLIETLEIWARMGVDAFRCDVAPLIPLEFWRKARDTVSRTREVMWLAESGWMCFVKKDKDLGIPHLSDPELHQVFDMTYDADGGEYLLKYFRGEAAIKDYLHQVYLQEVLYPPNAVKMRFLECHDDPRFAAKIRDHSTLRCWTAFSMLLPGAMMLFAGQEFAIDGRSEGESDVYAHNHHPVDWKSGSAEFHVFVKRMIEIMKEIKSQCSVCHVSEITRGVVKIEWLNDNSRYLALLNLESKFGKIAIDFECDGIDLLTCRTRKIGGTYAISMEPVIIRTSPGDRLSSQASWHV